VRPLSVKKPQGPYTLHVNSIRPVCIRAIFTARIGYTGAFMDHCVACSPGMVSASSQNCLKPNLDDAQFEWLSVLNDVAASRGLSGGCIYYFKYLWFNEYRA